MITYDQIPQVLGQDLYDRRGDKVGQIKQIYLDSGTDQPEWLCVKTGKLLGKEIFVPIDSAEAIGDHVEVAYDKERLQHAPDVDTDNEGMLLSDQERLLLDYYGTRSGGPQGDIPTASDMSTSDMSGSDIGSSNIRSSGTGEGLRGDDAMTLSEERMRAETEVRQSGRARLRKYVVTETETVQVPVSHEELRIEREPITEANRDAALSGEDITEAEQEITLHEERPVVTKETTPVERVRAVKETRTGQETVSGDVRKERLDVESDIDDSGRGR
jgi:uncharacterized protein (TIGR02271 family)